MSHIPFGEHPKPGSMSCSQPGVVGIRPKTTKPLWSGQRRQAWFTDASERMATPLGIEFGYTSNGGGSADGWVLMGLAVVGVLYGWDANSPTQKVLEKILLTAIGSPSPAMLVQ